MADHLASPLASVDEAIAQLRSCLLALSANPAGHLLAAHEYAEEIAVCVALHHEDQAKLRTEATKRDKQNRIAQLRRNTIRAETTSPRGFIQGVVAKGLPDQSLLAQPNTRKEIEQAFGIEPKPRDGGETAPSEPIITSYVPVATLAARTVASAEGRANA